MALINPYLQFDGNAEEAFNFYKSVFGGEFATVIRYKDMSSPENPVVENEANKIMHIALPIGKNILMASDFLDKMKMGQKMENGNRYSISISAESREEADKLFNGLSSGGKIEMPLPIVHGVHILECLQTNTASSGWWIMTQNIRGNCNHIKTTKSG